ncbi:MAG: hypothetical protein R3326_06665 [Gemmatimonadota bacterium]|nr:hypothetical protein [Gemmatimonadota bacterium]
MRTGRALIFSALLAAPALLIAAGCSDDGGPTAIEIDIARLEFVQECIFVVTGSQCAIVVQAFTEEDQQIGNPVLRWSSSNSSSVRIDEENQNSVVVVGVSPGSSTITVSNSTATVLAQTQVRVAGPTK